MLVKQCDEMLVTVSGSMLLSMDIGTRHHEQQTWAILKLYNCQYCQSQMESLMPQNVGKETACLVCHEAVAFYSKCNNNKKSSF